MLPTFVSGRDDRALKARVAFGAPDQEALAPPATALERRYALRAVKLDAHLIGIDPDYRLHAAGAPAWPREGISLTEIGLRCGSSASRRWREMDFSWAEKQNQGAA
jgi:hypothetical protein